MVNCPVCALPISAGVVEVNGVSHHPKCFCCKKCGKGLRITAYRCVKGKFYCDPCVDKTPDLYHAERAEKAAIKFKEMNPVVEVEPTPVVEEVVPVPIEAEEVVESVAEETKLDEEAPKVVVEKAPEPTPTIKVDPVVKKSEIVQDSGCACVIQ